MKRSGSILLLILMFSISGFAFDKKDKKSGASAVVDSGSFGIFVNGRRIGTENFQIHQDEGYSTTTSQLRMEDGSDATQEATLEILSNGNLRKYEWRELHPTKAQATVQPSDTFLVERLTPKPGDKPTELAFILPPSTAVMDDYFFSHREILLWRYIATACGQPADNNNCHIGKLQFGVFVPREQTPSMVTLQYKGKEKVPIHGVQRELDRFDMNMEGLDWSMYVDSADKYKLQRITVASEKTEIVRD